MNDRNEDQQNRNIEIHSDEIEDVLGRQPKGILRWGITVILLILLIVIIGSWFFTYPDIIPARVEVTSMNPPAYIESRVSGKLEKIMVADKQMADSGAILAIMENPASYLHVGELKDCLIRSASAVKEYDIRILDSVAGLPNLQLGEIQPFFTDFLLSLEDYVHFLNLGYHSRKIQSFRDELTLYSELINRLTEQQDILAEDRLLKEKDLNRSQQLFDSSVITQADMERSRSEYLRKELSYEESREELANARIQIARLRQNILDLGLQEVQQLKKLQLRIGETYGNLLAQINIWENQYALKAPFKGMVTFTQYWTENQNVNLGDKVMAIIPVKESQMIGKLRLGSRGAGKVKVGQDVNVKFQNFPFMEFGMVKGIVNKISTIPSEDEFYLVEILFPEGLRTNYGIDLKFNQKMTGQAEIITEDIPLLIRIIRPVRSLFRNRSFHSFPENQ